MTGGQTNLILSNSMGGTDGVETIRKLAADRTKTKILKATKEELASHTEYLDMLEKKSGVRAEWLTTP